MLLSGLQSSIRLALLNQLFCQVIALIIKRLFSTITLRKGYLRMAFLNLLIIVSFINCILTLFAILIGY